MQEEETDPNIGSESQVYLFVYDENHLIDFEVKPEITAIQNVHENYESIIPCRPTHPNVTITIFRNGRDITNILDKYHYQFDPKRGIIIEKGNKVHHRAALRARHDCLQRLSLHPTVAMSVLVTPLQDQSEGPVRRVGRVKAREGPGGPVGPGSTGHQSNLFPVEDLY